MTELRIYRYETNAMSPDILKGEYVVQERTQLGWRNLTNGMPEQDAIAEALLEKYRQQHKATQ